MMINKTEVEERTTKSVDLPRAGFVRMCALIAPYGPIPACRSTLYAWIQAGIFPAPVPIGPGRIKGFRVEDVRAFLAQPQMQKMNPSVGQPAISQTSV